MTDQEIIIEVAKLAGWTNLRLTVKGAGAPGRAPSPHGYPPGRKYEAPCVHYTASRDAIIPVIAKFFGSTTHGSIDFQGALYDVLEHDARKSLNHAAGYLLLFATPRQLCIALLKVVGKWRERYDPD